VQDRSALVWVKSSKCDAGNCVEVAHAGAEVLVRDSFVPGDGTLAFSRRDWATFVNSVVEGELAHPGE
jgi:hypothetical protein